MLTYVPRMNCPFSKLECRHNSHNGAKHFLCKTFHFEVPQTLMDIMAASADNMTAPKRIYNSVMAMGFLAMITFQLDNTKR